MTEEARPQFPISPTDELIIAARRLARLIEFGVPLIRALHTLEQDPTSNHMREIARKIGEAIEHGETFSGALRQMPEVFSEDLISIIHAAEASGTLEEGLLRLEEMLAREFRTERELPQNLMSRAELADWSWRLGHLIDAGVPILQALKVIATTSRSPLKEMSLEMRERINRGERLAEPESRFAPILTPWLHRLIQVGENTGRLDAILRVAAEELGREAKMEAEGRLAPLVRAQFEIDPEFAVVESKVENALVIRQVNDLLIKGIRAGAQKMEWIPGRGDVGQALIIMGERMVEVVPIQSYTAVATRMQAVADMDPYLNEEQEGQVSIYQEGKHYPVLVRSVPIPGGIKLTLEFSY